MDICFLTCICLCQISQIQTFMFKVVGPGLVSTSPAFVSNSASHRRMADMPKKTVNWCWWHVTSAIDRGWCATLFALTRQGLLDVVGSFDGFFIVLHTLRLVCVILVSVMTYSHFLFLSYVILSISLFPDSMMPHQKGSLNSCPCMLYIDFLISQFDREHILFYIFLLCVF